MARVGRRIGLAFASDAVRAVAVDGERILWSGETRLDGDRDVCEAALELLSGAPRPHLGRATAAVALGPQASQVRIINGLPSVSEPPLLRAVIREGVDSFFLRPRSELLTSGVRLIGSETAIAAAVERDAASLARDVCTRAKLRLFRVAPTAVALSLVKRDGIVRWADGNIALELGCSEGRIESIRTRPLSATAEADALCVLEVPRERLGALDDRFADAIGAALLDEQEPLALDPATEPSWALDSERLRRWRVWAVAGCGLFCSALAPLASVWADARAAAIIAAVSSEQQRTIEASLVQLDRVTAAIEELRVFSDSLPRTTALLAELTRALPDGHAVIELELAGPRTQLVLLTTDASAALSAVRTVSSLREAELHGALSNDGLGGPMRQRVAIRAGYARPATIRPVSDVP